MTSGLDVHYDLGDGHPLIGRRMPDLDLLTLDGPTRVFALLHDARWVLLKFGQPDNLDDAALAGKVTLINAEYHGAWSLPVVGDITAPPAVLIRPDGHVAWVGEVTDAALLDALSTWFGH